MIRYYILLEGLACIWSRIHFAFIIFGIAFVGWLLITAPDEVPNTPSRTYEVEE